MAKFKKGQSGNPAGRPEGSKNRNYLNASIWLSLLWEDVQSMTPVERQSVLKWATEQILAKVQVLPATPGDSATNAASAFNLMNGLAPNPTPLESNPTPPHANGNGANGAE